MLRLVLLALVMALFSCASAPDESGLYSDTDNVLIERSREMYFDANNSRRGRTVCTYKEGNTLRVEAGYTCPPVFPDKD
jgi:hypothetical protein